MADADGRVVRAAQRRDDRRRKLLLAAQRTFSKKGFHATTIADIIQEARVARGTFYLYYPSKRAVFEALLAQMLAHISSAAERVDTGPGAEPIVVQMERRVRRLLEVVDSHRDLALILLREAGALDADMNQKLDAFYGSLCRLIEGGLRTGRAIGIVRPANPRILARLVLGGLKEVLLHWLTDPASVETEAAAKEILRYNLGGLFIPGRL